MTAVARIATERVPDVVLVPSESIFQRDGAPIVYKLDGSLFVETPIEICRRGKEQAIVTRASRPVTELRRARLPSRSSGGQQ